MPGREGPKMTFPTTLRALRVPADKLIARDGRAWRPIGNHRSRVAGPERKSSVTNEAMP
jgi:hypothetical protein